MREIGYVKEIIKKCDEYEKKAHEALATNADISLLAELVTAGTALGVRLPIIAQMDRFFIKVIRLHSRDSGDDRQLSYATGA